jgi:hypothetical protein
VRDLLRFEGGRRDLIKERLKAMEVLAVDDKDVGLGGGKTSGHAQAAEPGSHDDDARPTAQNGDVSISASLAYEPG